MNSMIGTAFAVTHDQRELTRERVDTNSRANWR